MANLLALTTYDVGFELRPLRSTGVTRFPHYYGPLRHPVQPGLSLAGIQLGFTPAHGTGLAAPAWLAPSGRVKRLTRVLQELR
jgi:hypothetical protein